MAIPTHNRRETVLMAVRSALSQTRPPVEVIVIADGCTDGTVEGVRALGDPRAIVLDLPKAPNYGYLNRNEALRRARGTVVSWLGDDDLYLPDHLERIGELYDSLGVDIVQATMCRVLGDGRLSGRMRSDWRVPQFRDRLLTGGTSGMSAAGVSHRVARALAVGGWRDMPSGGDRDLWRRMVRDGAPSALVPVPTALVFRPSGLTFEERVAVNASYLARLERPEEIARLQADMTQAVEQRVANLSRRTTKVVKRNAKLNARLQADMAQAVEQRVANLSRRTAKVVKRNAKLKAKLVRLRFKLAKRKSQLQALRSQLMARNSGTSRP